MRVLCWLQVISAYPSRDLDLVVRLGVNSFVANFLDERRDETFKIQR